MSGEAQAARDLLETLASYAEPTGTRTVKLATIASDYAGGMPRVTFDGESAVSGRGYPWLAPYQPAAGHRVLLLPAGTGYVILGQVRTA